jgi:hypothetical protein
MKSLFDPVVKEIIHLVQDQVDRAKNRRGAKINVKGLAYHQILGFADA